MQKYRATPASLREDLAGMKEFQITTFAQRHGEARRQMAEEIQQEAKNLYLYHQNVQHVFECLVAFMDGRRDHLIRLLNHYGKA
jgi:hypothetical protein